MNYWIFYFLFPQALRLPCNSIHLLMGFANLSNKVSGLVSKGTESISAPTQPCNN